MPMFSAADLPDSLPLFPLSGAMLLPRARLPLHIYEPRYLAMFDDVLKTTQRLVGMIQPFEDGTETPPLQQIGCAGRLTSFTETDDGRYMVTLTGISRFRVGEEISGFAPYRRAEVSWRAFEHDVGRAEHDPSFDRESFLPLLRRYFETEELSTDWDSLSEAEDEMLINSLSMMCPLGPGDKQALLEAPTLSARRETLVTLLEYALRGGNSEDIMQ